MISDEKLHGALMMLHCYHKEMSEEERKIIIELEEKIIKKYIKIED